MAKPNRAAELSQRLLQHLVQAAPISWQDLQREAAPEEPPEMLARALKTKPFQGGAIISVKVVPSAPVALNNSAGIQQLAESPELLRAALEALSTAGPWPIGKIAAKVAPPLKKPLKAGTRTTTPRRHAAAGHRRAEEGPRVGAVPG